MAQDSQDAKGERGVTLAQDLGAFAAATTASALPTTARTIIARLIYDVAGLCIAARNTEYVAAAKASAASSGSVTAIGHAEAFGPYDAALINGTAAHGEDYDDTFEGGPIHAGAVVVPAVLAAAEHRGLAGDAVVKGIATGVEIMCRMSLVAPQATHKAGFHPTAIFGAPAAAVGVAAALGLGPDRIAHAIGIAGSLAAGIIEYLADGSSTKRLHAGAAAQSGIRAALLAQNGFTGPATVLEGRHGFYRAFAPSRTPDFAPLTDDLGTRWILETVAFKPHACGTMTQPFIDCAIELARSKLKPEDIVSMVCEVAEGTVHRLWEPLQEKRAVPNGYAAKFSTPYCIAVGFLDGKAGFEQFTDARTRDPKLRSLAATVSYVIDPDNDYPDNFSGHIRATLKDGTVHEVRKPHLRGGAHEPLTDDEIKSKFLDNLTFGGWDARRSAQLLRAIDDIVAGARIDLSAARQ
jgi:2-methylcitrate dehydratase PrpD